MRLTFVNAVKYHLFTLYYNLTSRSDVPTDARYGKRGKGSIHWQNGHSWQSISYRFDAVALIICHSYAEVVKKVPRKIVAEYPEIGDVRDLPACCRWMPRFLFTRTL